MSREPGEHDAIGDAELARGTIALLAASALAALIMMGAAVVVMAAQGRAVSLVQFTIQSVLLAGIAVAVLLATQRIHGRRRRAVASALGLSLFPGVPIQLVEPLDPTQRVLVAIGTAAYGPMVTAIHALVRAAIHSRA